MKRAWFVVLLAVAGGTAAYWSLRERAPGLRYRLRLEVEVDGQRRSASSVLNVRYDLKHEYGGGHWHADVRGMPPVLDLGRHGVLVVAKHVRERDDAVTIWRGGLEMPRFGRVDLGFLPVALYGQHPDNLRRVNDKTTDVTWVPNAVWVRPSGSWRGWQQLNVTKLAETVSPDVRLLSVTAEPAQWQEVTTGLSRQPAWLDQLCRIAVEEGADGRTASAVLNLMLERREGATGTGDADVTAVCRG